MSLELGRVCCLTINRVFHSRLSSTTRLIIFKSEIRAITICIYFTLHSNLFRPCLFDWDKILWSRLYSDFKLNILPIGSSNQITQFNRFNWRYFLLFWVIYFFTVKDFISLYFIFIILPLNFVQCLFLYLFLILCVCLIQQPTYILWLFHAITCHLYWIHRFLMYCPIWGLWDRLGSQPSAFICQPYLYGHDSALEKKKKKRNCLHRRIVITWLSVVNCN